MEWQGEALKAPLDLDKEDIVCLLLCINSIELFSVV